MSKLNIGRIQNENEDGSASVSGISTFSSTAFLEVPKGTTAQRPDNPQPGMIRFNTDGGHLEYYTGDFWDEVLVENNTLDGGNRGLFGGGYAPSTATSVSTLDYITISSLGNAINFGSLTAGRRGVCSSSSSTRGLFMGGYINGSGYRTTIDFVTFSSTGNATSFGSLSQTKYCAGACSSSTRAVIGGAEDGNVGGTNIIDYVTIASTGNAQDFGDIAATGIIRHYGSCSSSTRGLFIGGNVITPGSTNTNTIQYITISTTGNSLKFGELSTATVNRAFSNSTRAVFYFSGSGTNTIEFVTIASTGNSQDFGDITTIRTDSSACSSPTRGVWGGGAAAGLQNVIDYVTIASTGNAVDFGDLTQARSQLAACSNGHGGL